MNAGSYAGKEGKRVRLQRGGGGRDLERRSDDSTVLHLVIPT